MENIEEIEQKIDELKWKSLPFFERLIWKKEKIHGRKFYTKRRIKELKWSILSCNVLLILFTLFNIYLFITPEYSNGLKSFSIIVLIAFIALRVELNMRVSFLKEARFLKHLMKELK